MPVEVVYITNANLFEYQHEVVVELHGMTEEGELAVISYTFEPEPDAQRRVRPRERIAPDYQESVEQALEAADYSIA